MAKVLSRKATLGTAGVTKQFCQALIADFKEGQEAQVALVYGKVSEISHIPSKLDPTKTDAKFSGEKIEFRNLITGEVSFSENAYFPGALSDALARAVENAEGNYVEFVANISVKRNAKSAVGYEFVVRVEEEETVSDPIAALRQRALASVSDVPALPAPEPKKAGRPKKDAA